MKLWKLFVILFSILICGVSYAGFWSNDPGIGPGTRLPPGLIIPNPIISDPQLTGLITLVPGSTLWVQGNVTYEPYSIITGPDGSTWNVFGITNLANLTMSTSGVLTFPDGSYWDNGGLDTSTNTVLNINGTSKVNFNNTTTLNFATGTTINGPDGSVWNNTGIQNLKSLSVVNNVSVGGNQTIGGSLTVNGTTILNGATTVINNFTADGTTTLNGPTNINNNLNVSGNTTLNNLTVTGNLTLPPGATATFPTLTVTQTFNAPDGSTWTTSGLNMQNGLSFHGVPMGGNCPATQYVAGMSSTGVLSCSTPSGTGGGGSTLPTPTGPYQTLQTAANNSVVWNSTIGAGIAPNPAFPLVVGTGGTSLYQFSGTALNFSAGVGITFNGVPPGGACGANQFMVALSTSLIPTCAPGGVVTSSTPPASPIPGVLWFDPVSVQLFIWYKQNGQMQWVPVINQPNSAVGGIGTGGGITQLSAGQGITLSPSPINNGASGTVSLSTSPVTPGSYTNANITVNSLGIITAASSGTGGGGSVSITAGNSAITVSPSPLTGTGTIALSLTPTACTGNQFVSAISATGLGTCTSPTGGGGGTVTSITAGTGLTGGTITTSGTIALATSGVTGGSYTNANITVNALGIVTAASNGAAGGGGSVTSITAGTGLTGGIITTTGTIALSTPVSIANGGRGSGTAPTAGQIDVAQSTTALGFVTMSGNATISATGALTITSLPSGLTISNPTITGTLTLPAGSVADAALASAYSGVGTCTAGQFVSALTRNAAPTCTAPPVGTVTAITAGTGLTGGTISTSGTIALGANPAGGQLNFAPLASPTFSGTIGYPDGSTYTSAGHNNMAGIGIGTTVGGITAGDLLDILGNVNGNVTFTVKNNASGSNAQVSALFTAGTSVGSFGVVSQGYTQSATLPGGTVYFYQQTNAPMVFWNAVSGTPGPMNFAFGPFQSGSATIAEQITSTGTVVGAPTGGAKGLGTINATGLYVNGVAVGGGLPTATAQYQVLQSGASPYNPVWQTSPTFATTATVKMPDGSTFSNAGVSSLYVVGTSVLNGTVSGGFNATFAGSLTADPVYTNDLAASGSSTVIYLNSTNVQFPQLASGTAGTGGAKSGGAACFTSGQILISNAANCIASSLSLKKDIRPLDGALATIEKLAPAAIYYRYKQGDPSEQPGFGAETVAQIDPRYALYDIKTHQPVGIRYEQMAATEAVAITELKKQIDDLKAQIAAMRRAGQ